MPTPYTWVIMATGLKENVDYRTVMPYRSTINSDDERIAKEILKEQEKTGNQENHATGLIWP